MTFPNKSFDIAVIGGGLTGLTAAVYLARAGKSVIVLEKENRLGGLAQSMKLNGALFNLSPMRCSREERHSVSADGKNNRGLCMLHAWRTRNR